MGKLVVYPKYGYNQKTYYVNEKFQIKPLKINFICYINKKIYYQDNRDNWDENRIEERFLFPSVEEAKASVCEMIMKGE